MERTFTLEAKSLLGVGEGEGLHLLEGDDHHSILQGRDAFVMVHDGVDRKSEVESKGAKISSSEMVVIPLAKALGIHRGARDGEERADTVKADVLVSKGDGAVIFLNSWQVDDEVVVFCSLYYIVP